MWEFRYLQNPGPTYLQVISIQLLLEFLVNLQRSRFWVLKVVVQQRVCPSFFFLRV